MWRFFCRPGIRDRTGRHSTDRHIYYTTDRLPLTVILSTSRYRRSQKKGAALLVGGIRDLSDRHVTDRFATECYAAVITPTVMLQTVMVPNVMLPTAILPTVMPMLSIAIPPIVVQPTSYHDTGRHVTQQNTTDLQPPSNPRQAWFRPLRDKREREADTDRQTDRQTNKQQHSKTAREKRRTTNLCVGEYRAAAGNPAPVRHYHPRGHMLVEESCHGVLVRLVVDLAVMPQR